eukprot:CAMPEP_0184336190 /NCGR_PEP_ID=MMETSP1089-20130417/4577_1 /TAXON_ID=38269 ORGANISM="Gloeochaete wittrockiana, Strain SAG46.84" /NCGR_SAMPLE_ID=MMETSP1089 /ASSEMBLY_ACC=CAM_ASM_000445 /LENGTH=539 /DNA_ID=CAMNT_0026661147 /DNA_START=82 /DNA_END=1701 /DNA_ORIENTATION=-
MEFQGDLYGQHFGYYQENVSSDMYGVVPTGSNGTQAAGSMSSSTENAETPLSSTSFSSSVSPSDSPSSSCDSLSSLDPLFSSSSSSLNISSAFLPIKNEPETDWDSFSSLPLPHQPPPQLYPQFNFAEYASVDQQLDQHLQYQLQQHQLQEQTSQLQQQMFLLQQQQQQQFQQSFSHQGSSFNVEVEPTSPPQFVPQNEAFMLPSYSSSSSNSPSQSSMHSSSDSFDSDLASYSERSDSNESLSRTSSNPQVDFKEDEDFVGEKTRKRKRPSDSAAASAPSSKKAKRSNASADVSEVTLSRERLLVMSSEDLEEFVKEIESRRPLSAAENREIKRQRRLIKNRESAQASRNRKKEQVGEMEGKVDELRRENSALKETMNSMAQEFQMVVNRLRMYEPSFPPSFGKNIRPHSSVFAVLITVSLCLHLQLEYTSTPVGRLSSKDSWVLSSPSLGSSSPRTFHQPPSSSDPIALLSSSSPLLLLSYEGSPEGLDPIPPSLPLHSSSPLDLVPSSCPSNSTVSALDKTLDTPHCPLASPAVGA